MNVQDGPITTDEQLQEVLNGITMVNTVLDFKWIFEFKPFRLVTQGQDVPDKTGWLVWVSFERPDTLTGQIGRGRGRDEIIYSGTWLSGVVKTAWLLVELMVRHELMEGFRFHDQRIFNPHNSVVDLMDVQNIHDRRMGFVKETPIVKVAQQNTPVIERHMNDKYIVTLPEGNDYQEGNTYFALEGFDHIVSQKDIDAGEYEQHEVMTVVHDQLLRFKLNNSVDFGPEGFELDHTVMGLHGFSDKRVDELFDFLNVSKLKYNNKPICFTKRPD